MTRPTSASNSTNAGVAIDSPLTRRRFVQAGSTAAATTLLAAPAVHAADDQSTRLALIGCGSRGSGAVIDALSVEGYGPVKLYAAADISEQRMNLAIKSLANKMGDKIDVPPERRYVGWDAYKTAIDSLRPGDVAMCTTRAYIRPTHVEYAVSKGINVFMEKPFSSDPAGAKQILRAAQAAKKNGVKIAAGLQCRHSPARQALIAKIRNGEMGEILSLQANRLGGVQWLPNQGAKANNLREQIQFGRVQLHWVGAGHMVDYLIHQIDECCWVKDAWPVSCRGFAGRAPNSTDRGQNLDLYNMEFTFADGAKAFCGFRRMKETGNDFATYLHGTKCSAQFSGNIHAATVHTYKDHRVADSNIDWKPVDDAATPWQYEWNAFIKSIRLDRPHNEAERAAYADLATQMGRAACHTGQTVTWDEMLQSEFSFCQNLEQWTNDTQPPALADENGQFEIPIPGKWTEV